MTYHGATLCLWAAGCRLGALLGFVPVWWRRGRARALSLVAVLATVACCQLTAVASLLVVVGPRNLSTADTLRGCMLLCKVLVYARRRGDLTVLLSVLKSYLDAFPLGAARWRSLFLFSTFTVVPILVQWLYQMSQIGGHGVVGTVAHAVLYFVTSVSSACAYMRIMWPLAVLRAAAADLRVDCERAVLAARAHGTVLGGHADVLDGHDAALAWRALRQRQFLLHDMVRKSCDVNGPCILLLLLYLASLTNGALSLFDGHLDNAMLGPTLLYYGMFMAYILAVAAVCQWPALQFQTLAMEVRGLSTMHRQAFSQSAISEVRWLLTSIERQDNRYDLFGMCLCDAGFEAAVLSTVSMYLFTYFTTQGFRGIENGS